MCYYHSINISRLLHSGGSGLLRTLLSQGEVEAGVPQRAAALERDVHAGPGGLAELATAAVRGRGAARAARQVHAKGN